MNFKKPKLVYSDFDGTLTDHNKITPKFFEVLDFLKSVNLPLVIVTGRSLSWAHFLITHFDLPAVGAEGGAVYVTKTEGGIHEHLLVTPEDVQNLILKTDKLLQEFPELSLTIDSFGRKTDRAIDLKKLQKMSLLKPVKEFLSSQGLYYSVSNVHLNFWQGKASKSKMIKKYNQDHHYNDDEVIFFGDSLNDQSAFRDFPHSVGVSNIDKVIKQMNHFPSVILEGAQNRGPQGVLSYLRSIFSK